MIMAEILKMNLSRLMFDFSWRQILVLANHQTREKAAQKHFSLGYLGDQGIVVIFLFLMIIEVNQS